MTDFEVWRGVVDPLDWAIASKGGVSNLPSLAASLKVFVTVGLLIIRSSLKETDFRPDDTC